MSLITHAHDNDVPADVDRRLDTGNDPWQDYAPQAIGRAMKRLGFDPRSPGPDRDD